MLDKNGTEINVGDKVKWTNPYEDQTDTGTVTSLLHNSHIMAVWESGREESCLSKNCIIMKQPTKSSPVEFTQEDKEQLEKLLEATRKSYKAFKPLG